MSFDPSRLYSALLNTGLQTKDNPLYQVIYQLITATSKITNELNGVVSSRSGSGSSSSVINQILFGLTASDGLDGQDSYIPGPQGSIGPVGSSGLPGVSGIDGIDGIDGISFGIGQTQSQNIRQIGITIDGGGSVLTTGLKGFKSFPVNGTIIGVRLLADQSGSIVIDIWKDIFANFPPTIADTITASALPTITTAVSSEDITLTGWSTSVKAGDVFAFNVNSVTSITRIVLELTIVIS